MSKKIDLSKISTDAPKGLDKENTKKKTLKLQEQLLELQKKLIASKKYGVLVILQGLDASGKDGVIRNVIGSFSPVDCDVTSYKAPSAEEKSHDFLWRIHKNAPALGNINIFDRSYYEDILVPSVMGYIDPKIIKNRYETINLYEKYLEMNNIKLIKIFLNVSEEVEKERLEERMINSEKFRKHNDEDRETFSRRENYMKVYEKILSECDKVKRNIIPADHNWVKTYMTAEILVKELSKLDLDFPDLKTNRGLDEYLEYVGIDLVTELLDKSNIKEEKELKKLVKKLSNNK